MKMGSLFLSSLLLACFILTCTHSRSIYKLNEKRRTANVLGLPFQDETRDAVRRPDDYKVLEYRYQDTDDDVNTQSCYGLQGAWFC